MVNKFEALGISEELLQSVSALGFTDPTPIQEKAIPVLLRGTRDFIGLAQTGTGETPEQRHVEEQGEACAQHGLPGRQPAQEEGEPPHGDVQGLPLQLPAHVRAGAAAGMAPVARSQATVRTIPSAKGVIW